MADTYSFDIVSEADLQLIDDVVNIAMKEINNRFDLKNTGAKIEFKRQDKEVVFLADADFQLEQIKDILSAKLAKRNSSSKVLRTKKKEDAFGGKVREFKEIVAGIEKDIAKKIVGDIKDSKIKVSASIQDTKIRVTSKSKDCLQEIMNFLREKDYPIYLDFDNYR